MRTFLLVILVSLLFGNLSAQETFPRNDVLDERTGAYAFTNATLVIDPNVVLESASMLIREGKIENVGKNISIPSGYIQVDLKGKFVYPGFIDIYTNYGLPDMERPERGSSSEQIQSNTAGPYNANQAIRSGYNASENFHIDPKSAEQMRKHGFGAVLSFMPDGIARGTSVFVTLGEESDNQVVIADKAAAHYSFNRGSSRQNFPSSSMGYIALLRQTYLDAEWYANQNPRPFEDLTLEAWNSTQYLPQIFEATDWLTTLRADKVGDEFGVQYIIKGVGDEYKRIGKIKSTNAQLIIPVNYPDPYDVEDPFDAERVSLADMKHWEMAPANLAALEDAGITFAVTSKGLENHAELIKNVRKAIKYGLSEQSALAALTTVPAGMIKMSNRVGGLGKGMLANFFISSDNIFLEEATIYENWIQGERFVYKDLNMEDFKGTYKLNIEDDVYDLSVTGDPGKQKAVIIINDSTKIPVETVFSNELVTLGFVPQKDEGRIRLSGWKTENGFKGEGQTATGNWISWSAEIQSRQVDDQTDPEEPDNDVSEIGEVIYPFVAHGTTTLPQVETILIKNATVWTNEEEGIIEGTDVLLQNGKIAQIGKGLAVNGAKIIDGTGKHLTPGIIDEHSHLAASSINDRATNSAMVRIGDVIDPEDIGIYRALGGGVVAAQILHGSANPIGGQSAIIKMRWGAGPEEMKIKGADGFIKFALGENVKRSRSNNSIRYPQTRMGVEQVYMDAFTNAREYGKAWKAYNSLSSKARATAVKPRRDLAKETILEIIEGRRFISCHSYVQSEINMLMKVAENFNFRVNTFTHILEGYKVADKMKAHGAGGSTFSDWWNYKWEVRYAIPYNAAIMHREGVVTAINSDDGEMIRRLNQEAAKSIKYGDIDEQDALKMVTLNPAKLLHLDDEMGSIKVGKSADVVLWTDHPLSIYTKAEKTILDGKIYFDLEKDLRINDEIRLERARLIRKMKEAGKNGAPVKKGSSSYRLEFHCEDILGEGNGAESQF